MSGEVTFTYGPNNGTGTHDGGNDMATLSDSTANFTGDGVAIGDLLFNITDGSSTIITATGVNALQGTLSGGTENLWDNNDVYRIIQLSNAHSVNVTNKQWKLNFGVNSFAPAVLRVLGDFFGGETLPNFIIYFGKFTEEVRFDVKFADDTAWKSFRKYASTTAYFESDIAINPFRFYCGSDINDPFFDLQNDVANMEEYRGWFKSITVEQRTPKKFWTGTITFLCGVVLQA